MEGFSINYEHNIDRGLIVKPIRILSFGGIVGGRAIRWITLDLFYDNLFIFLKVGILYKFLAGGIFGIIFKLKMFKLLGFYLGTIWFLPGISSKFRRTLGLLYGNSALKYWDIGWNEMGGHAGAAIELRSLRTLIKGLGSISYKRVLLIRLGRVAFLSIYLFY
jgi:hypothetical protein